MTAQALRHEARDAAAFVQDVYGHPDATRLLCWGDRWYEWDGSWQALEFDRGSLPYTLDYKGQRWANGQGYSNTRSRAAARAVRSLSELRVPVSALPRWIGEQPPPRPLDDLVAVRDGLLHLPTRELLPPSPAYLSLNVPEFDYDPDAYPSERWLDLLDRVMPDPATRSTFQEWCGYLVSGRSDHHKALALVHPDGWRVTSALTMAMQHLVGRRASLGGPLADYAHFHADLMDTSVHLVPLHTLPTTKQTQRLLATIDGATQQIRRKFGQPQHAVLPTRTVLQVYTSARPTKLYNALGSRLLKVAVKPLGLDRPRSYESYHWEHGSDTYYEEMPGVLAWALEGLERLNRQGEFTAAA